MSNEHLIDKQLEYLPWYIEEFINHKGQNSKHTLLEYCRDYRVFLDWLVYEKKYVPEPVKAVPLEALETLRVKDIDAFRAYCTQKRDNSMDTIARRISSLKALFHYLSQIAEDEDFYPYLKRNVMAKVEITRAKYTDTEKAERISGKILIDKEIEQFREFVATGYGHQIKDDKRSLNYYNRNRIRDLGLISLILGSGLRISEAVGLDIDHIDWHKRQVSVKRKGNKRDTLPFSEVAYRDLLEYKQHREMVYKPDKSEKAFFLSLPTRNGKTGRLSKNSAQKLVDKYAAAFGKGDLSVHKLRHTFATNHYKENRDINTLKRQLGHSNINTTVIYTHVFDDTLKTSVNKADK